MSGIFEKVADMLRDFVADISNAFHITHRHIEAEDEHRGHLELSLLPLFVLYELPPQVSIWQRLHIPRKTPLVGQRNESIT